MNPHRVKSLKDIEDALRAHGFEPTKHTTATGRFWKSQSTGQHLQVPNPYDGMYPEFFLKDLREAAKKLGIALLH